MTDDELVHLAREIPHAEPPRDQVEEMRTAVLAAMPKPSRAAHSHRARWLIGGFAIAAAAAVAIWIAVPSAAHTPANHATVTAIGEARYARISDAPDEIVRLTDGTLHIEVSPLHAGERFRVRTADGEVEVRGTAFDVEARLDRLQHVNVSHGRVEVRTHGVLLILGPGEHWDAPTVAAAPARVETRVVTPAPTVAPVPSPPIARTASIVKPNVEKASTPVAPETPSTESMFRAGWDALQAGDAATAAEAFDRVATLDPNGPLAEDAEFWRATAFARARKAGAARAAYATFLSDFPRSVRAGEVAVLLGWSLVEANDLAGAEAAFTRANTDGVARVRASAEAGLAEIGRRRSSR